MLIEPLIEYIVLVGEGGRVQSRWPRTDRSGLPFPAGVAAFALATGSPRAEPRARAAQVPQEGVHGGERPRCYFQGISLGKGLIKL